MRKKVYPAQNQMQEQNQKKSSSNIGGTNGVFLYMEKYNLMERMFYRSQISILL